MRARIALVVAILASALSLTIGGSVSAHTGFDSSSPAAGDTVDAPVDTVTIVFTGEATPVGDEFVALTPDGIVQAPALVETEDNRTFVVTFDPPLAGGEVGVRWNVQAGDGHPIEGAFAFTVTAPAPTSAPATTVPEPVATTTVATAPDTSADDADAEAPVDATTTDTAVASEAVASTSPPSPDEADEPAQAETATLDEFLAVDNSTPGTSTARGGRIISFLGVSLGLGALAFAGFALRGRRREIRSVLSAVRVLAAAVAVGAAIEYVGVSRIAAESLGQGWSTSAGFATVLRFVGGIALAVAVTGAMTKIMPVGSLGSRRGTSLSAAVIDDAQAPGTSAIGEPTVRWSPGRFSWILTAAAALIVVSFWFDGHTVTRGIRPVHAVVNSVHVVAGSVWVGGVVALAAICWARRRSGEPAGLAELVVRFSHIATIALVAVVLAGGVMAFMVLDSFGGLTGSPWGRTLLIKSGAVSIAALAGAYNHFRLVPILEADSESAEHIGRLRAVLTAEAVLLVGVVMVTASLVAAAT